MSSLPGYRRFKVAEYLRMAEAGILRPDERVVPTTVGRLAHDLAATGARTTVLVLVGPALAGAAPRCHLYDPGFAHMYRKRRA